MAAIRFLVLAAAFTLLAIWLQSINGALSTELSGYPDEPAHLVTGLMVRDYVAQGFPSKPMQYAENYYLHYPKVGFGIWPPLFHFAEAIWFLVIPPSKVSAFALQAFLCGLLAAVLARLLWKLYGPLLAVAMGIAFVTMPLVQTFTSMIMADSIMALMAFLAALTFVNYARSERMKHALLFGVLAGLALMSKSNAAALAGLPVIALLLLRKYRLLFAPATIVAALVAVAMSAPWQILVIRLWTSTVSANHYSVSYAMEMLRLHTEMYVFSPGVVIFGLAVVGAIWKVVLPYFERTIEPLWASMAGLVVSLFLFGFAPLPAEPRYHIAAMAGLLLFAAAGLMQIGNWIPWNSIWKTAALAGVTTVLYAATTNLHIPKHQNVGFVEAAHMLQTNPEFRDSVMLVSSENAGEGMFIAEVALNEARPGHYVLRGGKVLGQSRWNLDGYELLYKTPEEMMAYFELIPVRLLVVDGTKGTAPFQHHRMVHLMLEKFPEKWRKLGAYPASGPNSLGGRVDVYEQIGATQPHGPIRIDMRYTLKKTIQ